MINKNKHNRTHADQNGNSDFVIAGLLPVGKENAISTEELVKLIGSSSARELQQYIAQERKDGALICSSTTGGYFQPATRHEIAEFCNALERRAGNTIVAIQGAKRALESPEWQQDMEDID